MKLFKLWVHQQNFSEDELILNPKEFPNENVGDILEIHHPDEDNTRLLLQIKSVSPDFQQKDTISIEQSVANIFQLRTYWDVEVTRVEPEDVSVDMVELLFKDQFIARSEMWRFSKELVGSCVYITKKLKHVGVRAQVNEIWSKGEKVSCGAISENTRVVFRSCSSKVYLLIQMSKEMWDFDFNGDLFFEKAINGFLYELFTKWKELKANHDVSIILFSRTFYDAQSAGDFPMDAAESIQQDPYGRFYEDFYQVVALKDRREDWIPVLVTLKQCFTQYPSITNCCDRLKGTKITGRNSSSFDGNFLEAINLSMNVFERHYVDRNFERTGQMTIIVAPGSGVFEVDREMTSITKQRLLDSGVSIDLVCLAEQPLHTVPLLKYINKVLSQGGADLGDDYNIPHWMNHGFYTSPKRRNKTENFVPRIKVPDIVLSSLGRSEDNGKGVYTSFTDHCKTELTDSQLPDRVDYDEYDAKVFRNPTAGHSSLKGYPPRDYGFRRIRSAMEMQRMAKSVSRDELMFHRISPPKGVSSYEDLEMSSSSSMLMRREASSLREVDSRSHFFSSSVECTSHGILASLSENVIRNATQHEIIRPVPQRFAVGSAGADLSVIHSMAQTRPQRTLINPFKPNEIPCNWTCNRHRWSHVFPTGPDGEILHRHYHKLSTSENETQVKLEKSHKVEEAALAVVAARKREFSEASQSLSEEQDLFDEPIVSEGSEDTDEENTFPSESSARYHGHFSPISHLAQTSHNTTPRRRTLTQINLYRKVEVPIEHDWTAAVKTSIDWKSMSCPALLPLTTDFSPNKKTLDSDYLVYNYKLYIEEEEDFMEERKNSEWGKQDSVQEEDEHGAHRRLSAEMIFIELVSQRIRKGFQLITPKTKAVPSDRPQSIAAIPAKSDDQEFFLSIGRNSHKLSLTSPEVTVTKYRPRHQQGIEPKNYSYCLWIPQRKVFEPNVAKFQHEEMDNYNWNYLDQNICGDQEFDELIESLNYWKVRFLLLPFLQRKPSGGMGEKKKTTASPEENHMEGFLKFLEVLNRMKRFQVQKVSQISKERRQSEPCFPSRRHSKQHDTKAAPPLPSEVTVLKENSSSPGSPLISRSRSSSTAGQDTSGSDSCASPSRELTSEQSITSDESAVSSASDRLSVQSPLENVAEAMMDPGKGLSFLPELKGLKPFSFLSVEAISWITQHVDGVTSKEQAIQLCQKMLEAGIIQHASESAKQKLVEGFVIFCFTPKSSWAEKTDDALDTSKFPVPHRSSIDVERFEFDLLRTFQTEWFEVAIWPRKTVEEFPEFLVPDEVIEAFPVGSPFRKRSRARSARRSPGRLHSESDCGCGPAYKFVTLDADPHHKSQRPETCTVRYHGNFCPLHAFEIELHWIAATGSIVNDMVQSWTRKAPSCGFHIVPVPVSPFPDPVGRNVDPFRLPVFIPLNLPNCTADACTLFQDFDPSTRNLRMFLFLEAILQRFSFIRDLPYGSLHVSSPMVQVTPVQCRANDYVHTSGVAFVRISHWDDDDDPFVTGLPRSSRWGFYWMPNHMLTKRWLSAATGDKGAGSKLMNELEDFCADKNGVLEKFWESCKEAAGRAVQKCIEEEEKAAVKEREEQGYELNREGDSPDNKQLTY